MKKKKVLVFTGNRAEYGLQYSIIDAIKKHRMLDYKLIVSGAHLEKKFGNTVNQIKRDGFKITSLIKLNSFNINNKVYTPIIISDAIKKIALTLKRIKPDIVLVNADRFETFAATIASSQMHIPTYHVEGGDITYGGTLDDNVRHAISKLSNIHFVTNEYSKKNLIKMGEEKWRIFNTGLASNDLININKLAKISELENFFKINFDKKIILFAYHPVYLNKVQFNKDYKVVFRVIEKLLFMKKYNFIATYPNNDFGSEKIIKELVYLSKKYKKNFKLFKSLGNYYFHSLLSMGKKKRLILMGNSSSGIKESVAFKCPTLNIGSRQDGRLKPNNIIDVNHSFDKILYNIDKLFNDKKFFKKCKLTKNPYFKKNTGKKIANIISKIKINKKLIVKKQNFFN